MWKGASDCTLRNVVPLRNLKPGEGGLSAAPPSITLTAETPSIVQRSGGRQGDRDEVCG